MAFPSMSFMNNLATCPYNPAHRINPNRMAIHIIKCGKSHSDMKMETCPFNATHRVPPHQFQAHIVDCPDNALVLRSVRALQKDEDFSSSSSSSESSDEDDEESDFAAPSVVGVEETPHEDWLEPVADHAVYDARLGALLSPFVRKVPSGLSKRARQRWVTLDKQRVKELKDGIPFSAEVREAFSIPEGVDPGLPDYNGPVPSPVAYGGGNHVRPGFAAAHHSLISGSASKIQVKPLPESQIKLLEIRKNLLRRQQEKLLEENQQQKKPTQQPSQPKRQQQQFKQQSLQQNEHENFYDEFQKEREGSNSYSSMKNVSSVSAGDCTNGNIHCREITSSTSGRSCKPNNVETVTDERPAFTLQRMLQQQEQLQEVQQHEGEERREEQNEAPMQTSDTQKQQVPSSSEYEKLMREMQKIVENYQKVLSENEMLRNLVLKNERCEPKLDELEPKGNERGARDDGQYSTKPKLSSGQTETTPESELNVTGTTKVASVNPSLSSGAVPKRSFARV